MTVMLNVALNLFLRYPQTTTLTHNTDVLFCHQQLRTPCSFSFNSLQVNNHKNLLSHIQENMLYLRGKVLIELQSIHVCHYHSRRSFMAWRYLFYNACVLVHFSIFTGTMNTKINQKHLCPKNSSENDKVLLDTTWNISRSTKMVGQNLFESIQPFSHITLPNKYSDMVQSCAKIPLLEYSLVGLII